MCGGWVSGCRRGRGESVAGVYFRELAHAVVETGKPQIRRVDNQAGDPRK